jgi:hypothetical protein
VIRSLRLPERIENLLEDGVVNQANILCAAKLHLCRCCLERLLGQIVVFPRNGLLAFFFDGHQKRRLAHLVEKRRVCLPQSIQMQCNLSQKSQVSFDPICIQKSLRGCNNFCSQLWWRRLVFHAACLEEGVAIAKVDIVEQIWIVAAFEWIK